MFDDYKGKHLHWKHRTPSKKRKTLTVSVIIIACVIPMTRSNIENVKHRNYVIIESIPYYVDPVVAKERPQLEPIECIDCNDFKNNNPIMLNTLVATTGARKSVALNRYHRRDHVIVGYSEDGTNDRTTNERRRIRSTKPGTSSTKVRSRRQNGVEVGEQQPTKD